MEKRLIEIGLSSSQIHNVISRLSPDMIPVFIDKWKREKHLGGLNNVDAASSLNRLDRGQTVKYLPRIIPDTTSRISSKEMNAMYQEKSQSRIDPVANLDIMAVQLFGTPENGYTEEYLNKTYRRLALSFHPDKHGGDATKFNMLTTAFKHLKNKYFSSTNTSVSDSSIDTKRVSIPPPDSLFEAKFDPSVFNDYYEKNSFKTNDHGYGDWLKSGPNVSIPERPSESNFNSAYESHKKQIYSNNKNLQITKYGPPEDAEKHMNFAVLGEDTQLEDYSGQTNDGISYTDLRKAHENTHLIYEDNLDSNNISGNVQKDFMRAKQNLQSNPGKMSQTELDSINQFEEIEREKEENRVYRLRQYDEDLGEHFKRIHHSRLTM